MQQSSLIRTALVSLLIVIFIAFVYVAKPLLMPLTIAAVLALLLMPFCEWLERKGLPRVPSALVSVLFFLVIVGSISVLLAWQVSHINTDLNALKENITKSIGKLQEYVKNIFGVSISKQKKMMDAQSSNSNVSDMVTVVLGSLLSILVKTVLTIVYIFFLLYFRRHIKNFILKLVSSEHAAKTKKIISESGKVVQHYLLGLAMIIGSLWVMYSIGFTLVGIHGAIFFAILSGLLEVVPFVGNLTGSTLTVIVALSQGGGINMVIGVLITYAVVQTIQFYIISPVILGDGVNINPLFIIIAIIAGDLIWGVAGMFLAIPLLGMAKIVFDNIEPLKPYGFLIGQEKKKNNKKSFPERIKKLFSHSRT